MLTIHVTRFQKRSLNVTGKPATEAPFGRVTERIEHYVDGVWEADQPDQDRATRYSYDPLGRVTATIVNAVDGDPETGAGADTDLVTSIDYNFTPSRKVIWFLPTMHEPA